MSPLQRAIGRVLAAETMILALSMAFRDAPDRSLRGRLGTKLCAAVDLFEARRRPDLVEVVQTSIGRRLGKREREILAHLLSIAA